MKQKRLTSRTFKKLLEAHPRFPLIQGSWCHQPKKVCGGCAMTLAYKHANPDVKLQPGFSGTDAEEWAKEEYGSQYTSTFISWFDSDSNSTGRSHAAKDGIACRKLAQRLGRLPKEAA